MQQIETQQKATAPNQELEISESQGKTLSPPTFQLKASAANKDGAPQPHQETLEGGEPIVKIGGGTYKIKDAEGPRQLAQRLYFDVQYSKLLVTANPGALFQIGETIKVPVVEIPMGKALRDRADAPNALRKLLATISQEDFEAYRNSLSQAQRMADGNFIQRLDMMRETGMTMDEMGDKQLEFMEQKAEENGQSVGEYMVDVMKRDGLEEVINHDWQDIKDHGNPSEWKSRFGKLVERVRSSAPDDVLAVLEKARQNGGGKLIFKPEEAEKTNAFAFTKNDWCLYGGVRFVKEGEFDIRNIFASILHELGGHNEYGDPIGGDIAYNAFDRMSAEDQKTVKDSDHYISDSFGYFDTELWSELREYKYDLPTNPTDRPFDAEGKKPQGVQSELKHIKAAFEPSIAISLVKSLYQRAKIDDTITPEAVTKFAAAIQEVFGIELK